MQILFEPGDKPPYNCVTGTGGYRSFQDGYHRICSAVHQEKYQYLFHNKGLFAALPSLVAFLCLC